MEEHFDLNIKNTNYCDFLGNNEDDNHLAMRGLYLDNLNISNSTNNDIDEVDSLENGENGNHNSSFNDCEDHHNGIISSDLNSIPNHNVVSMDELILSSISLQEDMTSNNLDPKINAKTNTNSHSIDFDSSLNVNIPTSSLVVASTKGDDSLNSIDSDLPCGGDTDNGFDYNESLDMIDVSHSVSGLCFGTATTTATTTNTTMTTTALLCPSHEGSDLKYYCSHCETAVCETCTQTEHIGHLTVALSEAIVEHKLLLTSMMSKVKQLMPQVVQAMEVVGVTSQSLAQKSIQTQAQIAAAYDELIKTVEARKHLLISEVVQVSKSKEEILLNQKKRLKSHLLRMTDSCEIIQDSLKNGNDTDIVLVKKEMYGKLNNLISNGPTLLPETNDLLPFDNQDLDPVVDSVSKSGSVYHNTAVPYHSSADGEAFNACVCGKPTSVTVTTRDKDKLPVICGGISLCVYISTDTREDRLLPEVKDQENGTYELVFTLPTPGIYYLSIFMFEKHIKGSPYKIRASELLEAIGGSARMPRTMVVKPRNVKRPSSSRSQGSGNRRVTPSRIEDDLIMRIGVKGRNKGEFYNPQGLCFSNDKIVVADSNNQNIQVLAPSGECKLRFGNAGRVPGKVQRPTGVALTHTGQFLVADYDNRWISVFDEQGKYVSRIGTGKLQGPKGIAVDKEGRIIVVDNKASCVLVFQANAKFLHRFGTRGNSESQFAGPHYVAIGKNNEIIVSDFHNHCVKVFDSGGHFKFAFGSNGEGNGQFNAPTGVAVDERGNILVADWGNSRIQVFDASGSFLTFINTSSKPLYGPQGLAVTAQGVAVVADSGNHCIKYYKYLQ